MIADEILETKGANGLQMRFRVRLFQQGRDFTALLTDLDRENPGMSLTNGVAEAVACVLKRWPEIPTTQLRIVEHYDDRAIYKAMSTHYGRQFALNLRPDDGESFDFVQFPHGLGQVRLRDTSWKRTSKAMVKELIGEDLP